MILRDQCQDAGVARGADEGKGDRLAVEVLDGLDGRRGRHVPEQIGRADDLTADDTDRRTLGERAEGSGHAGGGRDVHTAGDQRLDRFGPGRRIKDLQLEPVLGKDAAALSELGNAGVPGAALRHRHLEHILRGCGRDRGGQQRPGERDLH